MKLTKRQRRAIQARRIILAARAKHFPGPHFCRSCGEELLSRRFFCSYECVMVQLEDQPQEVLVS